MFLRFVSGLGLFGLAAGLISGFHSRHPRDSPAAHLALAALFGLVLALALPVAAGSTIIAVPIVAHLASEGQTGTLEIVSFFAAFGIGLGVAGAVFGVIVIATRRLVVAGTRLALPILGPDGPFSGGRAA